MLALLGLMVLYTGSAVAQSDTAPQAKGISPSAEPQTPQNPLTEAKEDVASTPAAPPPEYEYSSRSEEKFTSVMEKLNTEAADAPEDGATAEQDTGGTPSLGVGTREVLTMLAWTCVMVAVLLILYIAVMRWGKRSPFLAGASLGRVLGRVYLNPKASLHYVESGGRVLVVGVTPTSMSLIAEFDAAAFDSEGALPVGGDARTVRFEDHLRAQQDAEQEAIFDPSGDPEITSIQRELSRLRDTLREDIGESKD
jgi:flagellar biogenesis protein FliO